MPTLALVEKLWWADTGLEEEVALGVGVIVVVLTGIERVAMIEEVACAGAVDVMLAPLTEIMEL
jgi:FixJ family two-component response regulator